MLLGYRGGIKPLMSSPNKLWSLDPLPTWLFIAANLIDSNVGPFLYLIDLAEGKDMFQAV